MQLDCLKRLEKYYDSEEDLEFFIRMQAKWNESSFQELKDILLNINEQFSESQLIPKLYWNYLLSLKRIHAIISNDLWCVTGDDLYKGFMKLKIQEIEELCRTLYGYCFY